MSNIRDVAKKANVSIATVSRVLNNDTKYKITEETRQRVLDAVAALSYSLPDHSPQHGAPSTKKAIGCVIRVSKNGLSEKYNDPYFMSILSAAEERLQQQGYEISFIRSGAELEENPGYLASYPSLSGLLMMDDPDDAAYEQLRRCVPHIVGIDTPRTDIDNIGYDRMQIAKLATEYLIQGGHKKIGFIGGRGRGLTIRDSVRYQGYQVMMHRYGLEIRDEWVLDAEWDKQLCAELVEHLCKTNNCPTAFFAASDIMAMAAMNRLFSNHINIPSQVAIIGISDIELASFSNPPLTTFRIPTREIGIIAADMLIARISGYDLPPQRILLPCELIRRGSA